MGMQQVMFVLQDYSPDEESLLAHMKDMILVSRLTGTGSGTTLLALFTDNQMHDAVDALARLRHVEVKLQGKV